MAGSGDVNGDGYADVVVGAAGINSGDGASYIYLGGISGLSDVPVATLDGPTGAKADFGFFVAAAGDVDGDRYADIIVGADAFNTADGAAYVYLGRSSGVSVTPSSTLLPTGSGELFGAAVATARDGAPAYILRGSLFHTELAMHLSVFNGLALLSPVTRRGPAWQTAAVQGHFLRD